MQFRKTIKGIDEYQSLIQYLNPMGFYQTRLYIISFLYWFFAGLFKTIFELYLEKDNQTSQIQCPYAFMFFQGFGIIFFAKIALHKGRRFANFFAALLILFGGGMICFSFLFSIDAFGYVGTSVIGMSVYSMPLNMLTLACEYGRQKYMPIILNMGLAFFCGGKIVSIYIIKQIRESYVNLEAIPVFMMLPMGLIQLFLCLFYYQSPRFLNIKDFTKSESLIKKIIKLNKCPEGEEGHKWEDSLLWEKLNLRKYGFYSLFKYDSLNLPKFSLIGCLLLLGVVSKYPIYFLNLDISPHSEYFTDEIIIVWISSFQIAGLLSGMFCMRVYERKKMCIAMSIFLCTVSCLLFFFHTKLPVVLDLTLLALNAFFSITLYAFLVLNTVEFFPHSIRVLGASFVISFYYFGQLIFYLYIYIEIPSIKVIELFFLASLVMAIYTIGLEETLDRGFKFQICQIQEEEENQF